MRPANREPVFVRDLSEPIPTPKHAGRPIWGPTIRPPVPIGSNPMVESWGGSGA